MPDEINRIQSAAHHRLIKNAFFSSLSWFLPIILTVFGTPIVVKGLGYEQYGLYALILGFISYSFTFGIGRVVTKYVSEYKSQGKNDKISEIISTTFWFSLVICLIGCSILILLSGFIVRDILQINPQFYDSAVYGLYMACASICFMMIGQVFQAVLQAIHRFDQVSLLITLNGFLLTIGNILLVLFGFGYNALLLWNLSAGAINCFLYFYSAKKYLPEFEINFTFRSETVKLILNYSAGVIGYQIFANVLLIFERSWIIRHLGAESLTFYVVPMTLALYLHAFISSIVVVIFPVISELQNDSAQLLKLYQRATKVIFMIVIFCALTMICAGKLFLTLWISEEFAEKSAVILTLHTVSFSVFSILVVMWQLAEGFGHPRFNALISFIWLIVAIPLMIILVDHYQNFGIALSRFTGNIITVPFILIGEKLFFGKVYWAFWRKLILIFLIAVGMTFLVETEIFKYLAPKWITLITGGILGAVTFFPIIWFLNFYSEDEKRFIKTFLMNKIS